MTSLTFSTDRFLCEGRNKIVLLLAGLVIFFVAGPIFLAMSVLTIFWNTSTSHIFCISMHLVALPIGEPPNSVACDRGLKRQPQASTNRFSSIIQLARPQSTALWTEVDKVVV